MFEEMVPPELRRALVYCEDQFKAIERVMAWAGAIAHVPREFEDYVARELARMRALARDVLEQYRRGQVPLDVAVSRLNVECDVDRLEPPSADQIVRRSSVPPSVW